MIFREPVEKNKQEVSQRLDQAVHRRNQIGKQTYEKFSTLSVIGAMQIKL